MGSGNTFAFLFFNIGDQIPINNGVKGVYELILQGNFGTAPFIPSNPALFSGVPDQALVLQFSPAGSAQAISIDGAGIVSIGDESNVDNSQWIIIPSICPAE